jgi:hypothetical protein
MLIIVDHQEFLYIINNIKIQYKIIEERVLLSSSSILNYTIIYLVNR